jgi:hypothetical protein
MQTFRNIIAQSLYQVTVLLILTFKGKDILKLKHDNTGHAVTVRNTVIFNAFVFCQIFNEFNSREPDLSDNFSVETTDIILESSLKSMSKKQLISHYIRVVVALRRDKEILLSEKTEEIYRLKRQCLRERGNGREIAALKRKLGDRTLSLALKENEDQKKQIILRKKLLEEKRMVDACTICTTIQLVAAN